jgi:hypothetical protein
MEKVGFKKKKKQEFRGIPVLDAAFIKAGKLWRNGEKIENCQVTFSAYELDFLLRAGKYTQSIVNSQLIAGFAPEYDEDAGVYVSPSAGAAISRVCYFSAAGGIDIVRNVLQRWLSICNAYIDANYDFERDNYDELQHSINIIQTTHDEMRIIKSLKNSIIQYVFVYLPRDIEAEKPKPMNNWLTENDRSVIADIDKQSKLDCKIYRQLCDKLLYL